MSSPTDSSGLTLQDVMNHISHHMQSIDKRFDEVDKHFASIHEELHDIRKEVRSEARACDEYKLKTHEIVVQNLPERVLKLEGTVGQFAA